MTRAFPVENFMRICHIKELDKALTLYLPAKASDFEREQLLIKILEQIELAVKERENELKQIAQEYKDKGFELETFIYSGFIKDSSTPTSPKEQIGGVMNESSNEK